MEGDLMQYPDRSLETFASIAEHPEVAAAEQGIRDAVNTLHNALCAASEHPDWISKSDALMWAMHMYGREVK